MADWAPLRARLAAVEHRLTISWSDLDKLVGGLPRSASVHQAFWSGARPAWSGFRARDVQIDRSVTFVRVADGPPASVRPVTQTPKATPPRRQAAERPDVVLIGCVKSKRAHRSKVRDLYTSSLFRKERDHAVASGAPWFVLSAQHGLLHPDQEIEPYELHLASTPAAYRRVWGAGVVASLLGRLGDLRGRTVEVHAGEAYVGAIRAGLEAAGATVVEPLAGLTMGERLAWYGRADAASPPVEVPSTEAVADVLARLTGRRLAMTPGELLAVPRAELRHPGLYSWWVDADGAHDLTRGLGLPVGEGLIYAGLAGATRSGGKVSSNTLHGRLVGMHLGSNHRLSTFRMSLGSVLAEAWGITGVDEVRLTGWMHRHLRVIAVPIGVPDSLDAVESEVLHRLDPPLNLAKMVKTPSRQRLSELRKQHGR